jgi:dUTP pyrophosphatase
MNYAKTRDVKDPTKGHYHDAGIDFFVPNDFLELELKVGRQCIIDAGIKVDVPMGFALIAFNKSGIATNKQLLVGACVIDYGYQGNIHINLHNVGTEDQVISPGDKIVQFVLLPIGNANLRQLPETDLFNGPSDRNFGGFGSTGTK